MKIEKKNNQYYGQFIEEAINSIINQTKIKNNTNFLFTNEEIEEMVQDAKISLKKFKNTGLGMSFDNFRIQIGWQNGSGLNNPTLRVFIKE